MSVKKRTSDRKRSRPVEKRSKLTEIKRNKLLLGVFLIVIIAVVIAAVYIYIGSNTNNTDENNTSDTSSNQIAIFNTSMGTFKIELYEDKVPITTGNFISLAKDGFYDGTKFHRISPGFMIQGGDPNSKDDDPSNDGQGGPGYTIEDEFHEDLKNERGMISMANSGIPNSGGSQFFILVGDATWLNNKHAAFGKVIEGMDVVDAIANLEHGGEFEPSPGGGIPKEDVIVNSITIENQ